MNHVISSQLEIKCSSHRINIIKEKVRCGILVYRFQISITPYTQRTNSICIFINRIFMSTRKTILLLHHAFDRTCRRGLKREHIITLPQQPWRRNFVKYISHRSPVSITCFTLSENVFDIRRTMRGCIYVAE